MPGQTIISPATQLVPVAQYVRMSTDHQQYSIANQSAAIALYAAAHNMGIVRAFVDAGKSGTTIKGRKGLLELLRVVESGTADFELILVYDVSRWGRFQDADEAAHYEYLCKCAGIQIQYCAEQFDNDNSPVAHLLKTLKRTMAGEYSRDLSKKVFEGQCRLASLGFHQGSLPGYGLRRLLIDLNGRRKQLLAYGERKSLETDRVILVNGPKDEVRNVRYIFDLFTKRKKTTRTIAAVLNEMGLLTPTSKPWEYDAVERVLRNTKYTGTQVYNRKSAKLRGPRRPNSPEQWIVKENALAPIVSEQQFAAAQALIASRRRRLYTDQEILDAMRQVLNREGTLHRRFFHAYHNLPGERQIMRSFGTFLRAYDLVGFKPTRHSVSAWQVNRKAEELRKQLINGLLKDCCALGVKSEPDNRSGKLTLNDGLVLTVAVLPFRTWRPHKPFSGWLVPVPNPDSSDIFLAARLDTQNDHILDYYIIPALSGLEGAFFARMDREPIFLEIYRSKDLVPLWRAVTRVGLAELVN